MTAVASPGPSRRRGTTPPPGPCHFVGLLATGWPLQDSRWPAAASKEVPAAGPVAAGVKEGELTRSLASGESPQAPRLPTYSGRSSLLSSLQRRTTGRSLDGTTCHLG
jgi:hypothetical protein